MSNEIILTELWRAIESRIRNPSPDSYVSRLINDEKGIDKILEKVAEESTEFILAVKNGVHDVSVSEAADLFFHILVALYSAEITLDEVMDELSKRRKK